MGYGQMLYVNVTTGEYNTLDDIYFHLKNDNGDIMLKGGPYYNRETTYHSNICLANGTYNFTIFGDEYFGLDFNGNYIVYTEENTKHNIIKGGKYFKYFEST